MLAAPCSIYTIYIPGTLLFILELIFALTMFTAAFVRVLSSLLERLGYETHVECPYYGVYTCFSVLLVFTRFGTALFS